MPPQIFSKMCERCEKKYFTYDETKDFCTDKCKYKKMYCDLRQIKDVKLTLAHKSCKQCGERTKYNFCNKQCENAFRRNEFKKKSVNKSFENLDKPKKKGISYEELNRRAEWKRLNDDESWLRKFNTKR